MKIFLINEIHFENVLCIIPLEPDDWLIKFQKADMEDMHIDPAMVARVTE